MPKNFGTCDTVNPKFALFSVGFLLLISFSIIDRGQDYQEMSLGIAFKSPEGIVLAADSRVTLTNTIPAGPNQTQIIPATFDNATKLLSVPTQKYVGAVTFGAAAIGAMEPRTAASFMPEFDEEHGKKGRLSVQEFAKKLGEFFKEKWIQAGMQNPPLPGNEMVFIIGGYDEKATYGRIFHVIVPNAISPVEWSAGQFGATWGGQRLFVDRLVHGFDPRLSQQVYELLQTPANQQPANFDAEMQKKLGLAIPWQFLPLQDCVDLSIFLIRTTIQLQRFLVDVRGVGGEIDVATITRTDGFKPVQVKEVRGNRPLTAS